MSRARLFAAGISMAVGMMHSEAAATEWSSFTDRVQDNQGITRMRSGREGQPRAPATAEPAGAVEAKGFIVRVMENQLTRTSGPGRSESAGPVVVPIEARSFVERAVENQLIRAGSGRTSSPMARRP